MTGSSFAHPSIVLRYARIGNPLTRSAARWESVLPALLRWQLRDLLGRGYRAVSLAKEMASTEHTAGRFSVTLDSGAIGVARYAAPIFTALRVPATVFVTVGAIGKTPFGEHGDPELTEPLMTLDDLKRLSAAGIEVGSRGMTESRLTPLADEKLVDEVRSSKNLLEDLLGVPVLGFSYPHGDVDERVRTVVAEAGYRYAVTHRLGALVTDTEPFLIPRIPLRWSTAGPLLQATIQHAYKMSMKDRGLLA